MLREPQIPSSMVKEIGLPSTHVETSEEHKETKTVEVPVFLTYQRGTKKLISATRKVFSPHDMEGTLPSSSMHRQILSPHAVEGALSSTSTK